jgi:hypothetical protein
MFTLSGFSQTTNYGEEIAKEIYNEIDTLHTFGCVSDTQNLKKPFVEYSYSLPAKEYLRKDFKLDTYYKDAIDEDALIMTADGVIEEIFRKTSLDKISKKYKSSCYSCEIGSIIFDDIDGKVQVKGYITFKIFFE